MSLEVYLDLVLRLSLSEVELFYYFDIPPTPPAIRCFNVNLLVAPLGRFLVYLLEIVHLVRLMIDPPPISPREKKMRIQQSGSSYFSSSSPMITKHFCRLLRRYTYLPTYLPANLGVSVVLITVFDEFRFLPRLLVQVGQHM